METYEIYFFKKYSGIYKELVNVKNEEELHKQICNLLNGESNVYRSKENRIYIPVSSIDYIRYKKIGDQNGNN